MCPKIMRARVSCALKHLFDRRACGIRRNAALAGIVGIAGFARAANEWPSRPITMVVPFAAGGPTDVVGASLPSGSAKFSNSKSWSRTLAAPAA